MTLMADRSATRYTAETRSVVDQSSAVEEQATQVCGRNFHIVRILVPVDTPLEITIR